MKAIPMPVMEPEDETTRLRERLEAMRVEAGGYHYLLGLVFDAGQPHPREDCICLRCEAWRAVRKELRGE